MSHIIDPNTKEGVTSFLYEVREEQAKQRVGLEEEIRSGKRQPRFRFGFYSVIYFAQVLPLLYLTVLFLNWASPAAAETNLTLSIGGVISLLLSYWLIGSPGEGLLHSKVLHNPKPKISVVRKAFEAHDQVHHTQHTPIRVNLKGVDSRYPIDTPEQTEKATFPWYIITAFWIVIFAITAIPQYFLPTVPIMIPALIAVTAAVYFYENKHAMDHFPEDWWRKQCRRAYVGRIFNFVHSQHLVHHWNKKCNFNVVGFFLIPTADWLFGTYRKSLTLEKIWLDDNLSPGEETMLKVLHELKTPRGLQWRKRVRKSTAPTPSESEAST